MLNRIQHYLLPFSYFSFGSTLLAIRRRILCLVSFLFFFFFFPVHFIYPSISQYSGSMSGLYRIFFLPFVFIYPLFPMTLQNKDLFLTQSITNHSSVLLFSHSVMSDSVTLWTAAHQASLQFTISHSLLKLMSIKSVMSSNHLIPCRPLLLLCSVCPSFRIFSNESALHIRWPKYWRLSINLSNEYSGLFSFRIHWFDLFAVQGTLKSLLQHHSSKASILQHAAFFMVQLSHPYMILGKIIALTILTFVGKVISLLFNMLSSLVITFPPRSKHLLISWLQSPSAVILEAPKIKSVTVSHLFAMK